MSQCDYSFEKCLQDLQESLGECLEKSENNRHLKIVLKCFEGLRKTVDTTRIDLTFLKAPNMCHELFYRESQNRVYQAYLNFLLSLKSNIEMRELYVYSKYCKHDIENVRSALIGNKNLELLELDADNLSLKLCQEISRILVKDKCLKHLGISGIIKDNEGNQVSALRLNNSLKSFFIRGTISNVSRAFVKNDSLREILLFTPKPQLPEFVSVQESKSVFVDNLVHFLENIDAENTRLFHLGIDVNFLIEISELEHLLKIACKKRVKYFLINRENLNTLMVSLKMAFIHLRFKHFVEYRSKDFERFYDRFKIKDDARLLRDLESFFEKKLLAILRSDDDTAFMPEYDDAFILKLVVFYLNWTSTSIERKGYLFKVVDMGKMLKFACEIQDVNSVEFLLVHGISNESMSIENIKLSFKEKLPLIYTFLYARLNKNVVDSLVRKSEIDKRISLTQTKWLLSMVRLSGRENPEHVFMILEGVECDHSKIYFIDLVRNHLNREDQGLLEENLLQCFAKIRVKSYDGDDENTSLLFRNQQYRLMDINKNDRVRAQWWEITREKVDLLLKSVDTDRNNEKLRYHVMGKNNFTTTSSPSLSINGHSCFSWAKEKINEVVDESLRIQQHSLAVWQDIFPEFCLKSEQNPCWEVFGNHQRLFTSSFIIFILLLCSFIFVALDVESWARV